jgi:hypothetical protein
MKIIRTFWGNLDDRYLAQIHRAKEDKLNEVVYVWGNENFKKLTSIGFECKLMSEKPYDYTISSRHTLYDHKNLIHKLKVIDRGVIDYKEILFLDWDCIKIKPLNKKFFELIQNGSAFKVPLYMYSKRALDWMIEENQNTEISPFFVKLKSFVEQHSFKFNENYVIPNTGFVYCRNPYVTKKLLFMCEKYSLETVPDELAVMCMAEELHYSLDDYIYIMEPLVIQPKQHSQLWWMEEQEVLNQYIETKITRDVYFEHL